MSLPGIPAPDATERGSEQAAQATSRHSGPRPASRWARRGPLSTLIRWVLLLAFALMFLYPFAWLASASLKPRGQVFDNKIPPETVQWSNYLYVWRELPLLHWLGNSLLIAVLAATLVTLSSCVVAFGFAYFRFPGRKLLFAILLGTMMLPGAVTLIPNYLIWKQLGWLGTNVPLWGGALFGSAFYIFMLRQFFLGVSRELFEAARIDGASYLGMFRRIALPLVRPSAIVVWVFEFQASWNNLQAPLIYLNFGDVKDYTVPLGIAHAMTLYSPTAGGQGDYQFVMVASLVVTIPMLVAFAFGQRYFIEGLQTGSVKG